MKKLLFKPTFVKTKNVRSFEEMMDGLQAADGEGRLGLVWGRAGRGKTRTVQWWAAHHLAVYLRVATVWRTAEGDFLRAVCRELKILDPPARKGAIFAEAVQRLLDEPRPVFIDELEKMPRYFLDLVRDLSDMAAVPVVLIGEEELVSYMKQNRRVWSRTFRQLQFEPIAASEIVLYASDTTGLKVTAAVAKVLLDASGGDIRIVKRDLLRLIDLAAGKGVDEADETLARMAVKAGLSG
jgi:DNA transposition AAA+ family ATPase